MVEQLNLSFGREGEARKLHAYRTRERKRIVCSKMYGSRAVKNNYRTIQIEVTTKRTRNDYRANRILFKILRTVLGRDWDQERMINCNCQIINLN